MIPLIKISHFVTRPWHSGPEAMAVAAGDSPPSTWAVRVEDSSGRCGALAGFPETATCLRLANVGHRLQSLQSPSDAAK